MPEDNSAPRVSRLAIQQNHGFSRGTVVRFDGDDWVLAVSGESGCGMVGSVADANTFEFVQLGFLDGLDGGLFTPGQTYYVSVTSPGELTTEVTDTPLFNAYSATTGFVITASAAGTPAGNSVGVTAAQLATAISTEVSARDLAISTAITNYGVTDDSDDAAAIAAAIALEVIRADATYLTSAPSLTWAIRTITVTGAATIADRTILVDATAGNVIVTLPAVVAANELQITVKKIDSTANTVTIQGDANIDGAGTLVLDDQWAAETTHSNGVAWFVVYRAPAPGLSL